MKRLLAIALGVSAALALNAASAWAWGSCPVPGGEAGTAPGVGSIRIKGTYYDGSGNVTAVSCDSNSAAIYVHTFNYVGTGIESPAAFQFGTAGCGPLDQMLSWYVGHSAYPQGPENQIISNGSPRRECVFHGSTTDYTTIFATWAVDAVRKFDADGNSISETGTMSLNTTGPAEIFTGKFSIRYR